MIILFLLNFVSAGYSNFLLETFFSPVLLWPNMNVIFGTCSFGCTMCHARIKKSGRENFYCSDKSHFKAYHYLAAAAVGHHGVSHDKVYIYQLKIESGYSFVEPPFGKRGHLLRHGWCHRNSKSN